MSEDRWVPLSVRRGQSPRFEPVTGVPEFLAGYLRTWVESQPWINEDQVAHLGLALRLDVAFDLSTYGPATALRAAFRHAGPLAQLDILDWLLGNARVDFASLRRILDSAGHELTVSPDGRFLMERVEPTMLNTFEVATRTEDAASDLLAQAWELTFGRDPSPTDGWGHAVKAIEALLAPIVSPNDSKATLGKMTGVLRDKPEAFSCALPDRTFRSDGQETVKLGVEVLTDALATIGYQPGRHGGDDMSEADRGVARNVVLLATSVVAWLREGALTRKGFAS
ncbi:MAG: hypothetical protein E7K79_04130 [Actinomyces urogenitalis]|nr:hypothetical protein [Actinomyces urogenitalis]